MTNDIWPRPGAPITRMSIQELERHLTLYRGINNPTKHGHKITWIEQRIKELKLIRLLEGEDRDSTAAESWSVE